MLIKTRKTKCLFFFSMIIYIYIYSENFITRKKRILIFYCLKHEYFSNYREYNSQMQIENKLRMDSSN